MTASTLFPSRSSTNAAYAAPDGTGNYAFTGLANGNYTVTPSKSGFTFSPASLAVTINGANVAGQNFTGTASTTGGAATTYLITIQGFAFSPTNLDVPPGATVTVQNLDGVCHDVTSEAAIGNFSPGAVAGIRFETGPFASRTRTFTIPANAGANTVVPYFCNVHRSMMPQATVTIQPGAAPNGTPSGGGTTGGGGNPMPPTGGGF